MNRLKDYIGKERGKTMLVVGGGSTIKDYKNKIEKFIKENNVVIIGVNKLMKYIIPTYYLWTNAKRYSSMGDCIDPSSRVMFGSGLSKKIIHKHYYKDDYIIVDYTSNLKLSSNEEICYKDGRIFGHFRTAGCLAIMICSLFEASEIFIAGMDGYTLYDKKELDNHKKNHHCYGSGYTDTANWKTCKEKDKIVYNTLRELRDYGILFKIITPTIFKEFFDSAILESY